LRVLIVDDDADTVQSTAVLLRFWGYEAVPCWSGPEALGWCGCFRPDVVLLDLAMPQMDGFQLAELLRQRANGQSLTLIAVTGMGGREHRQHCQQAGFAHFLLKPVEPDQLQAVLQQVAAQNAHPPRDQIMPPLSA
jgi:CheY-like chemotaxis protein